MTDATHSPSSRTLTVFSGSGGAALLDEKRAVTLPVDTLKANLADFVSALKDTLPSADPTPGLHLTTVTVAVGIDGKGKVGFLGTGVEVGGNATLTLTFDRR